MGKKSIGERTCIGCGKKAPKSKLLRFVVAENGNIVFELKQKEHGRGGYFCPRNACFHKAAKKKRIAVRFRKEVNIDMTSFIQGVKEHLS